MTPAKLTYFDFAGGRGEAARLALHLTESPWIDDRIALDDWPALKASTPFSGLPVLEVPGRGSVSQSNAILGFLGREYGLLPTDSFEAARHVAVMNAVEELRAKAATTSHDEEDATRKARAAFASGYFARWAKDLSAEIRGPFVGGDTLSVADLKVFVAMRSYAKGVYDHIPADILEAYPKITALMAAVAATPRVADWYAS